MAKTEFEQLKQTYSAALRLYRRATEQLAEATAIIRARDAEIEQLKQTYSAVLQLQLEFGQWRKGNYAPMMLLADRIAEVEERLAVVEERLDEARRLLDLACEGPKPKPKPGSGRS
jgi:chromosome segregation ATPase